MLALWSLRKVSTVQAQEAVHCDAVRWWDEAVEAAAAWAASTLEHVLVIPESGAAGGARGAAVAAALL